MLKTVDEKEITDFIRFSYSINKLNAKYQTSNYGSQEQDLKFHYEMIKCYKNVLRDKMVNSGWDDHYDDVISEIVAEDRDDKLHEVLS